MNNEKQNKDKETISRLREALANMNLDYMQTKLELDQMKGSKLGSASASATLQKPDLGTHLLKLSSKVKAFQSNINTKLATAGIQINNVNNVNNASNINGTNCVDSESDIKDIKDVKETRRLRDDIESLQTQIKQLKKMLKHSMEEKDGLQKERNELLMKYGEADQEIKRLKQQSIDDSNRYEQLLDSFRAENSSQIEIEKKKLYKECDEKINNSNANCKKYKEEYEELQTKLKGNEQEWNNKFDLIITERNSLKRKVKSLQNDLSEYVKHQTDTDGVYMDAYDDNDNDNDADKRIEQLKTELVNLKNTHETEKTSLLNSIHRLSSKSNVHSNGSDMQFLVNGLSTLITEKEEIIESLTLSKKYLGHRVIELEKEIKQIKQ